MKRAKRIATLSVLALLGIKAGVVKAGILSGGFSGGINLCPNL